MAAGANARCSAVKALQKEFKELAETPVEGFKVTLTDESNLFVWDVAIFGPPQTLYEGGYFKNGNVCISILHSPGEDLFSDEHPSEQWNPTQNVSVISLLNEPNIHSAAHVDASVAYRKWIESKGKEKAYEQRVRELVERTKLDAKWDGVIVPTTLEEYCFVSRQQQSAAKSQESEEAMLLDEDDYCFCGDDDEDLDEFDEIYGEAKKLDEVAECEDKLVACHRVSDKSLPSKNGVTSHSVKSSVEPNSPSTSFKG
ncbi:Ubiquitin-conjugating enzyme E2 R2 [Taenia crassiceps]|uniref:Ubiquitin-conjugating enzyme E2 R2 n=1 Tax=Taenia crassiceps TaxID=6207 RepID=A0ABR4QJQ5_9CEST